MIAIVGGGITGLAAAYELTTRKVPFVLLEAAARFGGMIQTEHVDGYTIEAGPDSVLAEKRAALDLFDELGLADHVISTLKPRTAFVLKRGRLHPIPSPSVLGIPTTLRGIAGYSLLSPLARARVAVEPFVPAPVKADESVAAFFARRFGRATVGLVAEPLLGGIHAGDVSALSMHSLFPRFVEAERARGSVLHAFKARTGANGLFRSLTGGMAMLPAAIVRKLPPGAARTGTPVVAVERAADGWTIRTQRETLDVRAVIVTAPATVAARLLASVDAQLAALCAEVPYVSSATVALAWRRGDIGHPLAGSGFVVARRYTAMRVTACTWVTSKWEWRAPAGMVLIRAFVGGAHDAGAVDLDDEQLVGTATRELGPLLGITGHPALARVHRWRRTGAQHNVGQLARVAGIETRLAACPGLSVAGSGFRATGIPDCIAEGRAAAAAAASYATIQSR